MLLPSKQKRAFAEFYRSARNNEHLDARTTQMIHLAAALGDGAYDVRAIRGRDARSVIPPKKRARVRGGPEFRDRDAAVLRGCEVGRARWWLQSGRFVYRISASTPRAL